MLTLVTGGTGLVGNNVVRLLVERGKSVRVLARQGSDRRPFEGLDVDVALGDIRNVTDIRAACEGVDVVVHAAAHLHIGWKLRELGRSINVDGTRNLAESAQLANARLIHVSTVDTLGPGAPGQPADEETQGEKVACTYVVTKREAEQVVLAQASAGLDAVIVNPGFMLGPWDWKPSSGRMLLEVGRRFTPVAPIGGMSLCDVRDVARGILAAIEQGETGRRYILAGCNMTYLEAWRLFAQVANRRGPLVKMGPLVRAFGGWMGDLRTQLTGQEGPINSAAIRMSSLFHYYSSRRAETELGYRCRPARESVEAAWNWFVQYGYV